MTKLFINYSDYTAAGEVCEGQENDSWPSYEDSSCDFSVNSITLERTSPYHDTIDYPLPEGVNGLFVLVARYRDGGTFSSTTGLGSIEGIFPSYEEAAKHADSLERGLVKSIHGYCVWEGYFASLERFEINLVPIIKVT